MAQRKPIRAGHRRSRLMRRWILGAAAPTWFRRIWAEPDRVVPKLTRTELDRMRRIAYL